MSVLCNVITLSLDGDYFATFCYLWVKYSVLNRIQVHMQQALFIPTSFDNMFWKGHDCMKSIHYNINAFNVFRKSTHYV